MRLHGTLPASCTYPPTTTSLSSDNMSIHLLIVLHYTTALGHPYTTQHDTTLLELASSTNFLVYGLRACRDSSTARRPPYDVGSDNRTHCFEVLGVAQLSTYYIIPIYTYTCSIIFFYLSGNYVLSPHTTCSLLL